MTRSTVARRTSPARSPSSARGRRGRRAPLGVSVFQAPPTHEGLAELRELGVSRAIFTLPSVAEERELLGLLDHLAAIAALG